MPIFYLSIIYFIKDQGKQKNNPKYVSYEFLTSKNAILENFENVQFSISHAPPMEK